MSISAMKQALDALKLIDDAMPFPVAKHAMLVLRQAIEQAEKQEPVCDKDPRGCYSVRCQLGNKCKNTPEAKREWVGLTEDEIYKIAFQLEGEHWKKIFNAIEAKLKEKNI